MSTLAQVWSLDMSPPGEAPPATDYGTWVVNLTLLYRVGVNFVASQLSVIPPSETRLRDEGVIPFYSIASNIVKTLKSSAHARGVIVPAIPDVPQDWSEEASTDYKALAAQLRPHLVESAREIMDWTLGLWDREPKLHWTSVVAVTAVTLDQYSRMAPAMSGMKEGSGLGPFVALVASDELKWIAGVTNEEILRIRALPGSGWAEEEAKTVVKEQLKHLSGMMTLGT